MFDGVKQLGSHAYFTLWVNYHTDRLITRSDRGVEEQTYSLSFKHNASVGARESQTADRNGRKGNCCIRTEQLNIYDLICLYSILCALVCTCMYLHFGHLEYE